MFREIEGGGNNLKPFGMLRISAIYGDGNPQIDASRDKAQGHGQVEEFTHLSPEHDFANAVQILKSEGLDYPEEEAVLSSALLAGV